MAKLPHCLKCGLEIQRHRGCGKKARPSEQSNDYSYSLHLLVRRQPAKLRVYSTEHSRISSSLEQLVTANWQHEILRTSQFERLRLKGCDILRELEETREAYEKTLQKERESYEKKLQGIDNLHNKILDENREYNDETLRHREQRDLALTESLTRISSKLDQIADHVWKSTIEYHVLDSLSDKGMAARYERIADAHAQTFEWIFQDYTRQTNSRCGDTFIEWLSHGTGFLTGPVSSGSQERRVLANLR